MEVEVKIWEDQFFDEANDNLVIYFEIPNYTTEVEFQISTKIYWKKREVDIYIPPNVFITSPSILTYTFQNEITIKGTLEIKKFSNFHSRDSLGIFANLYYYKKGKVNYVWHTEGFLISFAPIIPVPDEVEIIKIQDKEPITPEESNISADAYSDLFPYIYVSGWPKIPISEKLTNFFYYTPFITSPPKYFFITQLYKLNNEQDRKGMQSEAVSFIEGNPPYQSQYVTNVNELEGYIGDFKSYYEYLNKEKSLTLIVSQTCIFFKTDVTDFSNYLKTNAYLGNKERLWESYDALVIEMGYDNDNLIAIIEVLTLCNLLEFVFNKEIEKLDEAVLKSLFKATIVLDKNIFPLPPYTASPPIETPKGIWPYAIGDLQLVKYKLKRYELGELANVTSIMPGEKRKLVNRKLDRVIDKDIVNHSSQEESFTVDSENTNDFNEELWNAIAETTETTNYPDPGLVSSYGPPTNITVKGVYTKAKTTQIPEKKQVASFAKKVLSKATQKVSEKVNRVRTHTALKEAEDTSVSVINNSDSKEAVYGMYSWLNKVYETKVINYGNRMLFNFSIPYPAKAYIAQTKTLSGVNIEEPKSLEDFKINNYHDITKDNYLSLTQYYQIKKFPLYPQETIVVSDVITLSQSKLISLPDKYFASSATLEYAFGSGETKAIVSGFIGQHTFTLKQETAIIGTKEFDTLDNEQNKIAISAVANPSIQMSPPNAEIDFQMGVQIACVPLATTILTWQIALYQLLHEAYVKKETVYNTSIGSSNDKKETINPLTERAIVKRELEKDIRQQLLENAVAQKGLPLSLINANKDASIAYNQLEVIQYINNALEWDEMSYTFFDEYDNYNGIFTVSSVSQDFFSAFLKASSASVIIPVNPEFNQGFLYFLNTGIVWSSKDNLTPCFDDTENSVYPDQQSIVYEIKKTFFDTPLLPKIVDEWEVVIPTPMQILQDRKTLKIKIHE